jgi:hypothetical protein
VATPLLPAAALLLASAAAAEPPTVHVSGRDTTAVSVLVHCPSPLPGFVEERLRRGIPATFGLRVELWRDRSGWFDQHLASAGHEVHVARDPWGDAYVVADGDSLRSLASLDELTTDLERRHLRLPIRAPWCDARSSYRVVATTYVRPLTAKDVGEIEEWLKGEIRGFGSSILGLPRGLFAIVRDLSGLGERTEKAESPRFVLSPLPGGRVRVILPGTAAPDESRPPSAAQADPQR